MTEDVLSLMKQFEVESEADSKTKAINFAIMQETSKKISLHEYLLLFILGIHCIHIKELKQRRDLP